MNPAITNLAVSLGAMQSEYDHLPRPSTPPLHAPTRVTISSWSFDQLCAVLFAVNGEALQHERAAYAGDHMHALRTAAS